MFNHHYSTCPHLIPTPWLGVPSIAQLEPMDPEVDHLLIKMNQQELFQVFGMVVLTTCTTTAGTFLACCPSTTPRQTGWIGMAVAAVSVGAATMIMSLTNKKKKEHPIEESELL